MEIPASAFNALENNPDIESVDLDLEFHALNFVEETEDDDEYPESQKSPDFKKRRQLKEEVPWGVKAVQADQVTPGKHAGDKVCIVDTGYDPTHPDLPGRDTVTGNDNSEYSARAGNRFDVDGHGHGTHSAGVVAALGNGIGVVGILPDANPNGFTLHISKGLDDTGRGKVSGIIEAVEGCIKAGSDIIIMSLRVGGGFVPSFNEVLREAYKIHGILIVAAAGNDGNPTLAYPASYGSVMSVAAVKDANANFPYYTIAQLSQYNARVEIRPVSRSSQRFPGAATKFGLVLAWPLPTWGGGGGGGGGGGVAALLWSHDRSCSAQQIRRILIASSRDLGSPGCDVHFGHGLVQAKEAVDLLQRHGCGAADKLELLDKDGMNEDGSLCNTIPYDEKCSNGREAIFINAGGTNLSTLMAIHGCPTRITTSETNTPLRDQSQIPTNQPFIKPSAFNLK